jgi:adenine-specific DNA-methyltransferase
VQIGDENVHLARCVLDEVFGSENFVSLITVSKTGSLTGELLSSVADYLLWYARAKPQTKYRKLYDDRAERDIDDFTADPLKSEGFRTGTTFDYVFEGQKFECKPTEHWKVTEEGLDRLAVADRLVPLKKSLRLKRFWEDFPVKEYTNIWYGMGGAADMIYVVQTNRRIIERCLLMTTDPGDLVLDPTCGSGTTAYVAEQWGRRWITIDTSRVALALARTRLMAAKFPYYLLSDSPEGERKLLECGDSSPLSAAATSRGDSQTADKSAAEKAGASSRTPNSTPNNIPNNDIKKGFVYKRVPHVTLKSIANNPDIKEGMTRAEIDAAIARHADTELLYDQPYEDNKLLSTDEERPATEAAARKESSDGQFATMIIENLKKAGVQNTLKNERLKFDRLEPFAGTWIHAAGEYTEKDGKTRRVAVSIGPEHGTVAPEQVKEAAKEAVQGVGFDLLVVCGFAFDPHVSEEAKRYGKLMVMPTRMNYDLTMGDDLLKKTGAGNLFMYFGEPDIEVKRVPSSVTLSEAKGLGRKGRDSSATPQNDKGEKLVVTIKGLDIYDPTTGQIRSHSTDDIACWFIDTNYNGESFFVRHAYFTGAEEPYDKLKRALRAEIDEAAWSALYSTTSRPFDPPKTGKIAIKVINHYGDEVLKVYEAK